MDNNRTMKHGLNNKKQLLNQIIIAIRLHRQWNGGEWIYNSMTREYIIYLNNLCDQLEEP